MSFDRDTDSISSINQHFDIIERSNPQEKTCTLKSEFKGCVYIDPVTKQRRYLSPLEQFLTEQDQIFSTHKSNKSLTASVNSARSFQSSSASTRLETTISAKPYTTDSIMISSNQATKTMINSAEQKKDEERAKQRGEMVQLKGYLKKVKGNGNTQKPNSTVVTR